ncbi:hypothetical protein FOZ63_015663 [Perkinsus olseni]|uniref:Uncharacterized protein n=1 Tax=Perkinsus olseni TaxID=32597 RepID=A0A7J6SHG8_PEROL|nr:hypothetical protein FOZ63_015663 [Perkinsus olseni]KAF4753046.1 hypothetical protein FOZ62_019659 [Perkinsus olseni]
MASSEDRIMMYYINLIAESERREKEQQQQERSKDGRGVDRPPQDRRRAHTDEASAMTERASGPRKSRNDHGKKEKLKKRASSPTAVKSKKAKRKRPRQPEASPAPSSSSGINGGTDLVDDEELLIERRSTRNKFAIDDSPSLEEELHPKIVTISSGKLRDDRRPSSRAKQRKSKSNASRRRVRKPPADSSTDDDPGERKRRRLRVPSASSTDAEDEGSHASGGRRHKSADDSLDGVLPDWALEGAVRRSSRIREAREGSVVSDKSAGDEGSARRKRGRPRKSSSSSAEALKSPSRKTPATQRSATGGSSRSTSASKKSTERRRVSQVNRRSSWPPKTGSLEIKVSTVAPLNSDIGFLRMEMCPKAGWSRSGIWRRSIGLERVPRFPPLPLEAHSRDGFI